MNFISIQNMKWEFGKSYKLLCFQVRKSPAPLDIPTPTPAPDHLLGDKSQHSDSHPCTPAPLNIPTPTPAPDHLSAFHKSFAPIDFTCTSRCMKRGDSHVAHSSVDDLVQCVLGPLYTLDGQRPMHARLLIIFAPSS